MGEVIKLWHDDVRPAPDGWVWAQNNQDAMAILMTGKVAEISMDHDLGASPSQGIYARGLGRETGLDLAVWLAENPDLVPAKITVHSWNPLGAERMAQVLNDAGFDVIIAPFVPEGSLILGY